MSRPIYPTIIEQLDGSPHVPGRKSFRPIEVEEVHYTTQIPETRPILVNKEDEKRRYKEAKALEKAQKREAKLLGKKAKKIRLGRKTCFWKCTSCNQVVPTEIRYSSGGKTWLSSCCVGALTCCLCFCAPFCMNSCKNVDHYCPLCGKFLGSSD
ncbi:unnamed protein product, partial [Mesorhabditis belari]|uniref:LITAF domain-containing protein n=1 Tax=Mesorhabditis belari TaxID=2138241 RepID=A0AAF3JAR6_9BILA